MRLQRTQRRQKSVEHEAVAETLAGSAVINAFRFDSRCMVKLYKMHEQWKDTYMIKVEASEWLTVRMSWLSSLVLFASSASIVGASSQPPFASAVLIHVFIACRSASRAGQQYLRMRRGLVAVKRL